MEISQECEDDAIVDQYPLIHELSFKSQLTPLSALLHSWLCSVVVCVVLCLQCRT